MTITLEKAMVALEDLKKDDRMEQLLYEVDALQLGIEALKHYQNDKNLGLIDSEYFLPGETKE